MNIVRSETCERFDVVPRKTYESRFWRNVYEIRFGSFECNAFLVNADNESDALDELMNHLEESGAYPGYVSVYSDFEKLEPGLDDEEREQVIADFYVGPIGNHGLYLHDPYQSLTIEKLKI